MAAALMARVFGAATASALLAVLMINAPGPALLFGYFAILPLLALGLQDGWRTCGLAGAVGTVLVAVATGPIGGAVQLLVNAFPAFLVAWLAGIHWPTGDAGAPDGRVAEHQWLGSGTILAIVTAVGGLGTLLIVTLLFAGEDGGLRGVTERFLLTVLGDDGGMLDGLGAGVSLGGDASQAGPSQAGQDQTAGLGAGSGSDPGSGGAAGAAVDSGGVAAAAAIVAAILPGATIVSWLMMIVVNVLVAQFLLLHGNRLGRPPLLFEGLVLPEWLSSALGVSGLLAFLSLDTIAYLGLNAAIILSLPFFFVGLAVMHALVALREEGRLPLLIACYGFVFLLGWPVVLVIGLGIIEPWIGLRRRLARRS